MQVEAVIARWSCGTSPLASLTMSFAITMTASSAYVSTTIDWCHARKVRSPIINALHYTHRHADRTLRTYSLPDYTLQFRLEDHRAAVNAISMSDKHIVSGSGDRSMKIWNAETGELLKTFENHHGRGYANLLYIITRRPLS